MVDTTRVKVTIFIIFQTLQRVTYPKEVLNPLGNSLKIVHEALFFSLCRDLTNGNQLKQLLSHSEDDPKSDEA